MIKNGLLAGSRRWWTAGIAVLLAGAVVAGCSSSGDFSANSTGEPAAAPAPMSAESAGAADADSGASDTSSAYDMAADDGADADWAEPEAAASDDRATGSELTDISGGPITANRQIIRTADITITVPVDPDDGEKNPSREKLADAAADAARAVRALVTLPGGYVAGSDGSGSAITVTLRIPAGSYDSVMDRLGAIGKVTDRAEATVDVTSELIDVKSRITSQQASVDRLRSLMTEAESMADVIAIESELSRREADLDSLQQRQAGLADQVALSTISVTVHAVPATSPELDEPPVERSAFMRGLLAGWDAISSVGRSIAALAGAILPFLPLIAVIVAALIWLARRWRRSRVRYHAEPSEAPWTQQQTGQLADSPSSEPSVGPTAQPGRQPGPQPGEQSIAQPVGDNEKHHDTSPPHAAGTSDSAS